MGDLIAFTESPWTVTSDAATWEMKSPPSIEVGRYDEMDLQLYVLGLKAEGAGAVVFQLVLETSMYGDDGPGWVRLGAFTAVAAAPSSERVTFRNLLRYARWRVTAFSNGAVASFLLSGIVRGRP